MRITVQAVMQDDEGMTKLPSALAVIDRGRGSIRPAALASSCVNHADFSSAAPHSAIITIFPLRNW